MTLELGRRLLSSGAITPAQIQIALWDHVTQRFSLLLALADLGSLNDSAIDQHATKQAPTIRSVIPALRVIERLPKGMCETLLAVPVRVDPRTGTVDVAAAEPSDMHIHSEFAFHLEAPVRLLGASVSALREAIDRLHLSSSLEAAQDAAPTQAVPSRPELPPSDVPIPLVRRTLAPKAADRLEEQDILVIEQFGNVPLPRRSSSPSPDELMSPFPRPPPLPLLDELPADEAAGLEVSLTAMQHTKTRDGIVHILLRGMRSVAGQVFVLAVRRDGFAGWASTGSVEAQVEFRSVRLDRQASETLTETLTRGWFLGFVSSDDPLSSAIGAHDETAAAVIMLGGRPVMLVLATRLVDTMIATRTAERLCQAAATALLRVVRTDKQAQ